MIQLHAYDDSQKYKEGKYIIERAYMKKEKWDIWYFIKIHCILTN